MVSEEEIAQLLKVLKKTMKWVNSEARDRTELFGIARSSCEAYQRLLEVTPEKARFYV